MSVVVRATWVVLVVGCDLACGSSDDAAPREALPCEVDAVLAASCRSCHGSPPEEGVPMSLVTFADTRVPYTSEPIYHAVPTWIVMGDAVRESFMPEPPGTIDDAARDALLDWIARGAPAANVATSCSE